MTHFRKIPGVGAKIAEDLYLLGCRTVDDVGECDPEELYDQLCGLQGKRVDRCMLYVFRCAVYYASNSEHDAEKLKWWNWKDQ